MRARSGRVGALALAFAATLAPSPARGYGDTILVSHAAGSLSTSANLQTENGRLSADGRYTAFVSFATNLIDPFTDGNNAGAPDVYLYDHVLGTTKLVSRSAADGTTGGNGASFQRAISRDGRFILFGSRASDLLPGFVDNNLTDEDLFLFDRESSGITLVTHAAGSTTQGSDGSGTILAAEMTPDGGAVVFTSRATNLIAGFADTNGTSAEDVFIFQRDTGAITLVSHASGSPATGGDLSSLALPPTISDDGNYVAYASHATDLVPGFIDANGAGSRDVFLFDRGTGANTVVSHASASPTVGSNAESTNPKVSGNGKFVAFDSRAGSLIDGFVDGNGVDGDVFIYKRASGTVKLASRKAGKARRGGDDVSKVWDISTNGNLVLLTSEASDLIRGFVDNNAGLNDVYLFKRKNGTTALVSRAAGTTKKGSDGENVIPSMTPDGRFVLYKTAATNVVKGFTDNNGPGSHDLVVFKRKKGKSKLVSHGASDRTEGSNGSTGSAHISADGSAVTFVSFASNHVDPFTDGNGGFADLYLSR